MSSTTESVRERMVEFVHELQNRICTALERVDGVGRFEEDRWERPGGGGGITRVISGGAVFEKGGVNTSIVHGTLPERIATSMGVDGGTFFATGLSLVLHPHSPKVPTVHANFRYFERDGHDAWFGGGLDLTPYVANEEDARHFHTVLRDAAARHDPELYPRFKAWCDEYFFIRHRGEARGVGGVFYDYLRGEDGGLEGWLAFQRDMGEAFLPAYLPIVERRRDEPFDERERKFQMLRRGRYVEFNLVYDRGTIFGLETQGRIESILMSLPPVVHFDYAAPMEETESERTLMGWLRTPREWVPA